MFRIAAAMALTLTVAQAAPPAGTFEVESSQADAQLHGTLVAVVDRPFSDVRRALADPPGWCAVLILDPNVHRCDPHGAGIGLVFGASQMPVAFSFRRIADADDELHVRLAAQEGPFGTKDHVMALEATPVDAQRTRVRLSSSQRFGLAARLATLAYFNTAGRGKVGFTVVGRDAAGGPVYVGDLRGGIERNLARHYFAILAYFDSLGAPRADQADRRVRTWLAHTQRYPLQLMEEPGYFERKAPDVRRYLVANR